MKMVESCALIENELDDNFLQENLINHEKNVGRINWYDVWFWLVWDRETWNTYFLAIHASTNNGNFSLSKLFS